MLGAFLILVQYVAGTVFVLGVLALLGIGAQTVLRRLAANRVARDRMTVNSKGSHIERSADELAQRTLTKDRRRASC